MGKVELVNGFSPIYPFTRLKIHPPDPKFR